MKLQNPIVVAKFESYPEPIRAKLFELRTLIFEVAAEEEIGVIEETLKWGQPSYLAKKGSTLRMDWKKDRPERVSMYFKCTSKLVDTFRAVYPDTFNYVDNREIFFRLDEPVSTKELKHCIALTLNYHKIKHLPRLGA